MLLPQRLRELRCCAHGLRDVALLAARASARRPAAVAAAACAAGDKLLPRGLPPVDDGGQPDVNARLPQQVPLAAMGLAGRGKCAAATYHTHLELLQHSGERGCSAPCSEVQIGGT